MRNKVAIAIFLLPSLALFIMIVIIPLFQSFYYSLQDWNGIGEQTYVGFQNYIELFGDSRKFWPAVQHTVTFALASLCIQLPLALLLALLLAGFVGRMERFFVTVYFIPVILSAVVIGQLWFRIYYPDGGLLNRAAIALGLMDPAAPTAWLGNVDTALWAVMIPVLWQYVGYHMLLYYSGIKSISPDIFEAAKIDGAGFWRTSFSITLPLLKPILQVSLTFSLVGSMKVFDLVKVITPEGGPSNSTEVISTLLVKTMIHPGTRYGYGSAMAVVLIVLCFLLYKSTGIITWDRSNRLERRSRRHG